ncbi:MAG: hypothetical protein II401_03340 [Bacteroidales bacterium]|nr:hypothetical protein [Bacteroidales bacterium]
MKRYLLTIALFLGTLSVFSQNIDCAVLQHKYDSIANRIDNVEKGKKELLTRFHKSDSIISQREAEIVRLNGIINDKNSRIVILIDSLPIEYKRGQNAAYGVIAESYRTTDFDVLIAASTKESLKRDLRLIGDDKTAKAIITDLKNVLYAQEVLTKPYSKVEVENAQSKLNAIIRTSATVNKLKELLENYEMCYDGLKTLIQDIAEIDRNEYGDSDFTIKKKRDKIQGKILRYMYDYEFTLEDYPYISSIILDLINRKQADVNASITDIKI